MKLRILLLLILLARTGMAQDSLSLGECRQMALENNLKLKMAQENVTRAHSLKEFAKTYFFPSFSADGMYRRVGSQFSLLNENMYLPVVPNAARGENGELDMQALTNNPELAQQTFAEIVPVTDEAENIRGSKAE